MDEGVKGGALDGRRYRDGAMVFTGIRIKRGAWCWQERSARAGVPRVSVMGCHCVLDHAAERQGPISRRPSQ